MHTVHELAEWHEAHAAYGGAGREFHERAASAVRIILEHLDAARKERADWAARYLEAEERLARIRRVVR